MSDQRTNQMRLLTKSMLAGLVLVLLTLSAPLVQAQMIPFDAEVGYRWLDVSGNEGMYRTQINERSGFLIRRLTMASGDFEGQLLDRFRLDISELGTGPAGSLRLELDRAGVYRLRLAYRGTESFSELPAFANPLLGQGIIPGQHTYDRDRRMLDVDLDFLPDAAITPFVGYSFNNNDSQGLTTYNLGQDEFLLTQDLEEQEREFRLGAGFRFGRVYGRVMQGWRTFDGSDSLSLAAGAGAGNNPGPVRGQPTQAGAITRLSDTEGSTPFTSLFVTGQVVPRLRLTGRYARFSAESDSNENESATGSFASFALGRFYTGLESSVASSAENNTWRGGARAEFELMPNVDLSAGYDVEHRESEGTALINELFLNSINFGGADRRDLQAVLEANSAIERDEDSFYVGASARALGPFAVRAEYRSRNQEVTVAPDLSEIVVPGAQGGTFERAIDTFDTSASFQKGGFLLGAAYRMDSADDPIFRTDYIDRDRIRLRAGWTSPGDFFRAGVTAEDLDQNNDRPDIGYDANTRQYSADAEIAPHATLKLRGSYSQFKTDSSVWIRRPENFTIIESFHEEDGTAIEGGFAFQRNAFSLDAGLSQFENEGSLPFDLERLRVRLAYDFKAHAGVALEWNEDQYSEPSPAYGDYDATRYGVYLRWRP